MESSWRSGMFEKKKSYNLLYIKVNKFSKLIL